MLPRLVTAIPSLSAQVRRPQQRRATLKKRSVITPHHRLKVPFWASVEAAAFIGFAEAMHAQLEGRRQRSRRLQGAGGQAGIQVRDLLAQRVIFHPLGQRVSLLLA